MTIPDRLVYLNGEFLPLKDARIPVMDRGFLFGDGVYEVVPAYGGRLFRLEQHLQRLTNSLNKIRLASPLSVSQWEDIFKRLVTGNDDQSVYLQITRGVVEKRDHGFPENVIPTVFVMCTPLPAAAKSEGVKAITLADTRWESCDVKAITLLANILLRQEAIDHGGAEAILIRDGFVTEGAASNVFAIVDSAVITPPKGKNILPGITRDLVLELALANGIPAQERDLLFTELQTASEIWLASSTREVLPVIRIDENIVGTGQPGVVWEKIYELFQNYKTRFRTGA